MRTFRPGFVIALAFATAGCGGGGGNGVDGLGYCSGTFEGGNTSFSCTSCNGPDIFEDNPFALSIDNNASSHRAFGFTGGGSINITIQAPSGMSFPAGADAGALILFPAGVPVTASFTLYNGNAPVAATSGSTIASGAPPAGAGSATYYSVVPASTIDRIELAVSASGTGGTDFHLNEVCGDR